MFYDRFLRLCDNAGLSPSKAAIEAGLSKSTVTKWKNNPDAQPTGAALNKLSAFFNLPISEILGEKEKPTTDDGDELAEYLEALKSRPEMRMLFQLSKDATVEEVKEAVRIIEAIRQKD